MYEWTNYHGLITDQQNEPIDSVTTQFNFLVQLLIIGVAPSQVLNAIHSYRFEHDGSFSL